MWSKAKLEAVAALLHKRLKHLDQELQINDCSASIHEREIMAAGVVQSQLSVVLRRSGMLAQVTACKPKQHTSDVPTGEVKSLPCYCVRNNVCQETYCCCDTDSMAVS